MYIGDGAEQLMDKEGVAGEGVGQLISLIAYVGRSW